MKTIFRFLAFISAALAFRFADLMEVGARFDADHSDVYWRRWGRHIQTAVNGNGLTGVTASAGYRLGRYYYKRVTWGADEAEMLQLCRDAISRLASGDANVVNMAGVPLRLLEARPKPLAFLTQDVADLGGAK